VTSKDETRALQVLEAGRQILAPVLEPAGFVFVPHYSGKSSGGYSACGAFTRKKRSLELHFRYSLGLVSYSVGRRRLSHRDYMRSLGHEQEAAYPGFSDDPLDGFRHLREDLERFGAEFLTGSAADFRRRVQWVKKNPEPEGFAAVGGRGV